MLFGVPQDNFDQQVLACLNPIGVVNGRSTATVFFIFSPVETRRYEVRLGYVSTDMFVHVLTREHTYFHGSMLRNINGVDCVSWLQVTLTFNFGDTTVKDIVFCGEGALHSKPASSAGEICPRREPISIAAVTEQPDQVSCHS